MIEGEILPIYVQNGCNLAAVGEWDSVPAMEKAAWPLAALTMLRLED